MTEFYGRTDLKHWKFTLDQTDYGRGAGWAGTDYDDSSWIDVESYTCWETYEHALSDYEGLGWFRTHFHADPNTDAHYQLHFDGIGGSAEIYINGKFAGRNANRYLPFDIDPTLFIKTGDNLIAIVVDNRFQGHEHIPGGQKVEWVLYGGLTHRIFLDTYPKFHISHLRVDTNCDGSAEITVQLSNLHKKKDFDATLSLEVSGLPECSIQQAVSCARAEVSTVTLHAKASSPIAWSPDTPQLYDLAVTLSCEDTVIHQVADRIGFRSIRVEGTDILLNGKKILLKGANRYDEYAPYGICPPEELIRQDLLNIKKMGMNIIRTHFPQDPVHYRIADEVGIMYMIEVPLNWWYPDESKVFADFCGLVTEAVDALDKTFLYHGNHPCWTIWSVGNECSHSHDAVNSTFRLLADRMRKLNCGRLITYAANKPILNEQELNFLDFLSLNRYTGCLSENVGDFPALLVTKLSGNLARIQELYPNMPLVLTEFGISSIRGIRGSALEGRFAEDFSASFLKTSCEVFLKCPNLRGLIIWCWADYRHRRGFVPGNPVSMSLNATYGAYGLVSIDRKPKQVMSAAMQEILNNWSLEE